MQTLTRTPAALLVTAAALAACVGAAARAQTIVDNSGSARDGKVGYWSSLVAGHGDVAISYYCEDDHAGNPPEMYTLRFAWRTGAQWQWTTVEQGAGSHTTMRRDAGGVYMIAYDTWAGIGFAVGGGTTWTTSTVDVNASLGPSNMSMSLDSLGRPHLGYMCYDAAGAFAMRYTWWNGSQWVHGPSEVIRTNIWTPTIGFSNTWLQLDRNDVPHVAFAQPSDAVNAWGPIRYGTLTNGVWTFEDLGVSGADPTLAFGPDNRPRMMFNSDLGVTYAYRDASGWHLETAIPNEYASGAALALSDTGQPYATFGMTGNEDQYLLRRDAGGWNLQRIDGDGTNGPHVILGRYGNSIDVDENGTPHVSYLNIDIYGPTHRCDLIYSGDAGGPPPCIQITQAPQAAVACDGQGASFTALGTSDTAVAYAWEWRPAGAAAWLAVAEGMNSDPSTGETFIAVGADASTLDLGAVGLGQPAAFHAVLTSDCGSVVTAAAQLSVGSAPTIDAQPQDVVTCGGTVQFSFASAGAGAFRWQWLPAGAADWSEVAEGANYDPATMQFAFSAAGASSAMLTLDGVQVVDGAPLAFRGLASSSCGEATSDPAFLSAGSGLQILDQPHSQTLCTGLPATFSIDVGDPFASAVWEMYNADLGVWTPISDGWNEHPDLGHFNAAGAGSVTITMQGFIEDRPPYEPKTGLMNLRCRVSGGCGEATSDEATLAVVACCPADFNADGFMDFFDYDDYVNCFESGECPSGKTADFNNDGFADFFDYDDFVAAFEAGC